jgi:hypothetical protein
MFEYFYHEILRNTIIAFGSLFNSISIKHKNEENNTVGVIKVPIAYGPTQKFLARLEQSPNLNKPIQITLPRMSFEFVGLTYDPTRKVTTTQTFLSAVSSDGKQAKKTYMPVPYNMDFELSIFTKLNDDMLQIIEQILPYFQPAYTLTVDLIKEIGEKRDIPIVLNSISMQDDYEGNFDTRRALIYTLRFTAKTYLFGSTPSSSNISKDIIQKVSIGFINGDQTSSPTRDLTYSVSPRALQSYSDTTATVISSDIDESTNIITVNNPSLLSQNAYFTIDQEEMQINSIQDNTLIVTRGADNTPISAHVSGSEIKLITKNDNSLIKFGDDFGFGEL